MIEASGMLRRQLHGTFHAANGMLKPSGDLVAFTQLRPGLEVGRGDFQSGGKLGDGLGILPQGGEGGAKDAMAYGIIRRQQDALPRRIGGFFKPAGLP